MFTGIITAVGRVQKIDDGARLGIAAPAGWLRRAAAEVGGSIAVRGVCLTVTQMDGDNFFADLSPETRAVCAPFGAGREVNLEAAVRAGDSLGGHFVTGHVDGAGEVVEMEKDEDGCAVLRIRPPQSARGLFAAKGSAAVDGVSLTVNAMDADSFTTQLIPHTLAATTLKNLQAGDAVNVEADLIARQVAQFLKNKTPTT